MRQNKLMWIGLGVLSLLILALFLFQTPYQFKGSVIEQTYEAPEIVLVDSEGQTFDLKEQKGKIVLLFFGYAACPDVCPTSLSDLKKTMNYLEEDAEMVQVVFITIDPDRDTPENIQKYTSLFNPNFLGLSGSFEELEPIWQGYGVYRKIDEESRSESGYLVDHSSRTYLIDQEGNLKITFNYGTDPKDVAADIAQLLK